MGSVVERVDLYCFAEAVGLAESPCFVYGVGPVDSQGSIQGVGSVDSQGFVEEARSAGPAAAVELPLAEKNWFLRPLLTMDEGILN
jgi:hypothetical protein